MFLSSLNIDAQIYQDEIKTPTGSSIVLVPMANKSNNVQQLVLKLTNTENKVTPHGIDKASQGIFREWAAIFPLYPVERAFADILEDGTVEVYVTFDAANIFSNTQIRNIKRTISELLEKELKVMVESSAKEVIHREDTFVEREEAVDLSSQRKADLDLRERFNTLKRENSDLQMALQQSKADELGHKENIGDLRLELEKYQRSLKEMSNRKETPTPDLALAYEQTQKQLADISFKLQQSQQEAIDKQREIQRYQSVVMENERYVNNLQSDYEKLKESSDFQLDKLLEDNDQLKAELYEFKEKELTNRQESQLIKEEMRQLISETEHVQEELKQKLQRAQFESDELRAILKENQVFEDRTHNELVATTKELNDVKDLVKRLETEKNLLAREWETKYQTIVAEKTGLTSELQASKESATSLSKELIELKNRTLQLEQNLLQSELDKKQAENNWQTRLMNEEKEKERLVQQVTLDKDQFLRNKEQEVKRLSDRLEQQKQLVDKLMVNQTDTQSAWQDNYETLAENYQKAKEKAAALEEQIQQLMADKHVLEVRLQQLSDEPVAPELPVVAPSIEEAIELEVAELNHVEVEETETPEEAVVVEVSETEEDAYYSYDEEDEDYEDDYDYDYEYDDEDYDYEYHEVDDLVHYHPESIEEDIEELLDGKDEDGKEKISKKDYAVYELYINNLKSLVDQAEGESFKAFADDKMKKFSRFKRDFEEEVKSPTLFSRKYKMSSGLANQMKAYVLMSRHLSVLLDVEVTDEGDYDYDYEYEYEDDYGYDDDYDYDYEYDYDYDYDDEEDNKKKSKK